jgi:hypothetical protein
VWLWFAAGFIVVFVGMALGITMYPMLPSGRGVVACPLWRYYLIEAGRALNSSGALGPASGSSSAAIVTALLHVSCSALGGAAAAGIGWAVRRSTARPRTAS